MANTKKRITMIQKNMLTGLPTGSVSAFLPKSSMVCCNKNQPVDRPGALPLKGIRQQEWES